jgi:tetratricopeptide (TPR) repeat protein
MSDPLNFGTGDELLRLAEEIIEESENLSSEQIRQVMTFVEKALERGVGNDLNECRSLEFIYEAINEPKQAASYGQKATELELARLMRRGSSYELVTHAEGLLASAQETTPETVKQILILIEWAFEKGVGAQYNLRARAHKVLAQVYAREPDIQISDERYLDQLNENLRKSEANRVQYVENADGFLLLKDAKAVPAIIKGRIEQESGARILDMLTKAVQRLPENCPHLHAEAYRLTAEILEALGDKEHAVEYYEYALLKNPKIGVKRRLDALKKPVSGIDIPK